jgi:hypothetical protein
MNTDNPFYRKSWDQESWDLTKKRKQQLPTLFGKTIEEIKAMDDNIGPYIAFKAIKEKFCFIKDGRLVESDRWNESVFISTHTVQTKPAKKAKPVPLRPFTLPDLIKALQEFDLPGYVIKYKSEDRIAEMSPGEIIRYNFDSTIYRAFHYEEPTQQYRSWKWYLTPELLDHKLLSVNNPKEYDNLLFEVAQSLVDGWRPINTKSQPSKMTIGVALKITNLLMKHLTFSRFDWDSPRVSWLHVPWDSFTLKPFRLIFQGNPIIPSYPSQGFVKTLPQYLEMHSQISEVADIAKVPRITYEFMAWDGSHRGLR